VSSEKSRRAPGTFPRCKSTRTIESSETQVYFQDILAVTKYVHERVFENLMRAPRKFRLWLSTQTNECCKSFRRTPGFHRDENVRAWASS